MSLLWAGDDEEAWQVQSDGATTGWGETSEGATLLVSFV